MKVGYKENEWLVVYSDENGDRQTLPFDFYEQAVDYANKLKERFVPINGVMTTRFYDHYVMKNYRMVSEYV